MTTEPGKMTYTVTAATRNGGQAAVQARTSTINFDGSSQAGETLPGPADLLCAALSACILKNVERFSHMLPFHYDSASIEVTAEREEPPPCIVRMHYRLRVVTDEPAARLELLHKNIRKFGTITNTLAAACEVTGDLEAIPTGASRGPRPGGQVGNRGTERWLTRASSFAGRAQAVGGGGGTVSQPISSASSVASRRARVAAKKSGASSRYLSLGQCGSTRSTSRR